MGCVRITLGTLVVGSQTRVCQAERMGSAENAHVVMGCAELGPVSLLADWELQGPANWLHEPSGNGHCQRICKRSISLQQRTGPPPHTFFSQKALKILLCTIRFPPGRLFTVPRKLDSPSHSILHQRPSSYKPLWFRPVQHLNAIKSLQKQNARKLT
ncbi:hypothetical protein BX600DRAFT_230988 [Xylariales sp. PMI_506]|nr:hypothetical protein BX600DRAFT_230988 [Xylariales sp. PMI_506]